MKATQRILDSVWTLTYEIINDHMVNISNYNREDLEGYDQEDTLPSVIPVENERRHIIFVKIKKDNKTTIYQVKNSKHIFSYHLEAEK